MNKHTGVLNHSHRLECGIARHHRSILLCGTRGGRVMCLLNSSLYQSFDVREAPRGSFITSRPFIDTFREVFDVLGTLASVGKEMSSSRYAILVQFESWTLSRPPGAHSSA